MKAPGANGHRVSNRWLGLVILDIPATRVKLILDHPDVSRAGHWWDVVRRRLGQEFELTFLSPSPEGATS
jgi:hypothetical protein